MSLFDSASLCVTPNGVKEGKLYSIKPTDGSGDLSVTRATTATRVNSAGLVELVPVNLFTYSEQFDNANWNKIASITANATTAPNGNSTADKITESAVNDFQNIFQSVSQNIGKYTYSIYLKKGENDRCVLFAGSAQALLWIDMTNWTSFSQSNVNSYSIDSVGNGWYRVQFTYTNTSSGNHQTGINLVKIGTTNTVTYLGNTSNGAFIWGAQLVEGSSAKDYYPTTTRLNIPRLDYTNGSCPSILVEPQRTNLLLRSQEFGTSPWAFGGVLDTISANSIISPDGTQNADTFVCGYTGYSSIYQSATTTSGTLYTFSVFAKKGNQNKLSIELRGADTTPNIVFDLNNGTILSGSGGTITSVGNGWYKCTLTKLSNSTSTLIIIGRGLTGSIGDTFSLYGAQLEEGSYSTSYIPTQNSSVTRNADLISKTGISSLIGQTEGTMFVEGSTIGIETVKSNLFGAIEKTSTGATMRIFYDGNSNTILADVYNGSSFQAQLIGGAIPVGQKFKAALAYKANDFALALNGVIVATDTSGSVPATDDLKINTSIYGNLDAGLRQSQLLLFKTRLTNAELAELTTL
jgi:hypothetical protein